MKINEGSWGSNVTANALKEGYANHCYGECPLCEDEKLGFGVNVTVNALAWTDCRIKVAKVNVEVYCYRDQHWLVTS